MSRPKKVRKSIKFPIIIMFFGLISGAGQACLSAHALEGIINNSAIISKDVKIKDNIIDLIGDCAKEQDLTYKDWRNPFHKIDFVNIDEADASNEGLNLQGIFLGSNRPSALIDDTVVILGQKVNQYTVIEIKPNTVVLEDDLKNQKVLSLKK